MSNISFDNPWLLFILIPLLAAVLVPFFITVRKENANAHNITAAVLSCLICVCMTLAISGMSYESMITETDVYVLADISYSTEHNLDEVQDSVEKIAEKLPKNSKMGVICFGRNYQLISDLGDDVPNVKSATQVDRSATDIASALRYAGNLFEDNVIKRIIVVTDGAETVASNNIIKVVGLLQDSGVYVDAVFIDDNLAADVKEVQIDGAEVTGSTYLGKSEQVNVLVRANCGESERTDGYLALYRNGSLLERKTASLYNGLNIVTMSLPTSEVGTFEYEAVVETPTGSDSSPYNNNCLFTQKVTDEKKVLFIGGSDVDVSAGAGIYGEDDVTYVTDVAKLPLSVEELCVYDEIALCNFDVRTIGASNMFLTTLSTLVDDYGKTLTTYGNTFVQEDTDGSDKALQQLSNLLPVRIGNSDQDTRLVAIVMDISLSMNFESRFDVAKRAAVGLLSVLNPTDMVMVIGFSGGVTEMLPPTYLTSTGVIINKINECKAENGTNLSAALKHTYNLMPTRFHDRQIIIISDGLDPESDNAEAKAMANEITQDNIAISAIGIYAKPSGDKLLSEIVNNPYADNRVFYKNIAHESEVDVTIQGIEQETQQIRIEGGSYNVSIRRPDEDVVRGINAITPVGGFWYNSAKSTTKTVLTATYFRDKITSFDVPLYAYRESGKGKVVSFLSDISSTWTSGWTDGSGGGKFLSNIPAATLPDERIITPFIVEAEGSGNSTVIRVKTSSSLQNTTAFSVTLTDPKGFVTTKSLAYGAGAYFATFATDEPGTYAVHLEYSHGDLVYSTDTEFSVSYHAEYDSFASFGKSYLYRLLTDNGSILELDEVDLLSNTDSAYTTYTFRFTLPLMIACAVLFLIGIIIRQLKWKDVTSFFGGLFGRRA